MIRIHVAVEVFAGKYCDSEEEDSMAHCVYMDADYCQLFQERLALRNVAKHDVLYSLRCQRCLDSEEKIKTIGEEEITNRRIKLRE